MRSVDRFAVLVVPALLLLAAPARAGRATVDVGACRQMAALLGAMRAGAPRDSVETALGAILDGPAYRVMFRHYNRSWRPNHLPPHVFRRMILSLEFPDAYTVGENERADSMLTRWRAAYDDLPGYRGRLDRLERAGLSSLVARGVRYAQRWLPPGWNIPDFTLIVLPQGGSPAFAVDGAQGYDFFQLPRSASGELDVERLVGTIAHESNHLGMRDPQVTVSTAADSVALAVVTMCVAEGVATEFISGPPAGRVPAVPGVPYHIFTPELAAAWTARVGEEPAMVRRMADLLDRATRGALSQPQLDQEMRDYWFAGAIAPAYVLGAEMFGAIERGLGRQAVFQAMVDPRQLYRLYNRAIDAKPELLGRCVRMPDRTVAQAVAIGER